MHELTLAAIALENRPYPSFAAKLEEAIRWVRLAARQGADLAVLPEYLNTFGPDGPRAHRPGYGELAFSDWRTPCAPLLAAAAEAKIAVVVSVMEWVGKGQLRNAFHFVDAAGTELGVYAKMYPTPQELAAGVLPHGPQPLIAWRGLKVGGAICFDTCFPEVFEAQRDADLFVIPSFWPGGTQLDQVARQYDAAVALAYPAWSRILDPAGREVAAAGYRHETLRFGFGSPIALATINFDRLTFYGNHNQEHMVAVQEKYGQAVRITFEQPNCTFHLESRHADRSARQIAEEFGLIPAGAYFADCRRQRDTALGVPVPQVSRRPSPVVSVRRLVADGKHNAFTSLIRHRGQLFLSFRRSSGHGRTDGDVALLRSGDDGASWQEIASPARDTHAFYEGHLREFGGRLLMYSGAFDRSPKLNKLSQQEFVSWSDDGGETWQGPQPAYDPRWRFWMPQVHAGVMYVAAYRIDFAGLKPDGTIPPENWEVQLLRSHEGLHWEAIATLSDREGGNETELHVDEAGVMHAYIRSAERPCHLLHRSAPAPFTDWGPITDCGMNAEGQVVAVINGRRFLAGRHRPSNGRIGTIYEPRDRIRTRLWVQEQGYWVDYAELPSGADNSYPGLVRLDANHLLMSYYSQHFYTGQPGFEDMDGPSDIFLAVVRTDAAADWGQLTALGRRSLQEGAVDLGVGLI